MPFGRIKNKLQTRGYWDGATGADAGGGAGGADNIDAGAANTGAAGNTGAGADTNTGTGNTEGGAGAGAGAGADNAGAGKDGNADNKNVDDAAAKLLKEVMDKKGTIKELQDRLKAFDGVDPAVFKQMISERTAAETKKLEDAQQWDKLKEQMVTQHQAAVDGLGVQVKTLSEQLQEKDQIISKLTIGHTFDSSTFIREKTLLTPSKAKIIYQDYFEVEGTKVVAYDKPKGETGRTPLIDGAGNPLAFEAAIQKIFDQDPEKDALLRSQMKPGAGSNTQGKGTNTQTPDSSATMTAADRIAAGLKAKASTSGTTQK